MAKLTAKTKRLSKGFLQAASQSSYNTSNWVPVGDKYPLKDIWDQLYPGHYKDIEGDEAEVIAQEFDDGNIALRIAIPLKDGSTHDLKLSSQSDLTEGDIVNIEDIYGVELHKVGSKPIVRYDVYSGDEAEEVDPEA